MKILATSDIHGENLLDNPDVMETIDMENPDIITFSGDIIINSRYNPKSDIYQDIWFEDEFIPFLTKVDAKVVFTLGNHDYLSPAAINSLLKKYALDHKVTLLMNEHCVIDGVKFYGNPWTTPFCGWNYNAPEEEIYDMCSNMDDDVDVFLTHQPPIGHCDAINEDFNIGAEHLGAKSIFNIIKEKAPRWTFTGHIHTGSHKVHSIDNSKIVNVSLLNEIYDPSFTPFVIDI